MNPHLLLSLLDAFNFTSDTFRVLRHLATPPPHPHWAGGALLELVHIYIFEAHMH